MTSAAKFLGEQRLELQHPSSNRFIGDVQPALGEQILDIAEAQGEAKVQPHRVSDDVGGESVASECDRYHHRPPIRNAPKFPVSVPSGRLVMPPNITLIPLPPKCRSSMRRKTAGSSCATTGSQTESSNPSTTSSTIAARLGTSSSINPGGSCPSAFAIGPMGPDQRVLVLTRSWKLKPGRCRGDPTDGLAETELTASGGVIGPGR